MKIEMRPIAYVRTRRTRAEDDHWGAEEARIELAPGFEPDALTGLDEFSHAEILFFFHEVDPSRIVRGARHPRNNPNWPEVGIFAQRGKNRPNRIGSTVARILRREGRTLCVSELDAIDGTPVLDIKPVMREFLPREAVRQPEWSGELMRHYWERERPAPVPAGDPAQDAGEGAMDERRRSVPGSCLCGAVRFEATLPSLFCAHCHCSMCRRSHGAGFVTWFAVPRAELRILAGEDRLVRNRSSDHATRSFCGVCGSSLFFETTRHPERIDVALANMAEPIDREPQLHVHFSDRAPWVSVDDSLPRLGGASGLEPIDP